MNSKKRTITVYSPDDMKELEKARQERAKKLTKKVKERRKKSAPTKQADSED